MNEQVQLLGFHLGDCTYSVRLSQVQRVILAVEAAPLSGAPDVIAGVINLQGKLVPLLNLRKRLGLEGGGGEREVSAEDQFIIALMSQRTVALMVDGATRVVDVPAEQIVAAERTPHRQGPFERIIHLEGGLLLIHDLDRFLSVEEEQALDQALTSHAAQG